MKGAIIGDIVGSRYEFNNIKTKKFPLFSEQCGFTDDTVMTVAVARALMAGGKDPAALANALIKEMRELGRAYPLAGYGSRFSWWLEMEEPKPYNSYGNGSAMRVSPCGFLRIRWKRRLLSRRPPLLSRIIIRRESRALRPRRRRFSWPVRAQRRRRFGSISVRIFTACRKASTR